MDYIEKNLASPELRSVKPWVWQGISWNPNLTMDFIEKYPDKDWNWHGISEIPNLTMDFIEKHSNEDWDWFHFSSSPNLTKSKSNYGLY
jgi:hypothetical protein